MNNWPLALLKVLMWFVSLSHIALGGAILISPELQQKVAELYGANVEWTPQFIYILRPLGVFMLTLGAIGVAAGRNPLQYQFIVYAFIGLLALRVAQRFMYRADIELAFGIDSQRNLTNAIAFAALALALLILLRLASRKAGPVAQ